MKARIVTAGLTALCVAFLVWWWFDTFEYVPGTPLPAERGAASYNPFYALERGLNGAGFDAMSMANLDPEQVLPPNGTIVLYADPSTVDMATSQRLLTWVSGGGHLVLRRPHSTRADGPLLGVFGLGAAQHGAGFYPKDCAAPALDPIAPEKQTELAECFERWLSQRFNVAIAKPNRGWIGRVHIGEGSVSVADLELIANRELRSVVNDDLVWWLLAPNLSEPAGPVLLIYSFESESLAALVLRRGWQPTLGLLLALGAFLWMRGRRFGPLLPAQSRPRRALLEHVLASARFAWHHDDHEVLNHAVRQQVLARARLPLDALDEPAIANLAARSGLDRETVRGVLRRPVPRETKGFIEHIATMLKLRRSI